MWKSLVSFLAVTASASATAVYDTAPIACVENGTLAGVYSPEFKQDFFLGIPYAQPPVDNLRFRQAQSLNTTWNGTRDANEYGPHCVGYGLDQTFYRASEDCLYLNVVRPSGYEENNLPVAFWIHGGAYTNGGGGDQRYNLSFIVDQSVAIGKPIIGVSINYRLSVWGFTSSNELAEDGLLNIGLRDQRLALHWVQENIAAFGGDASKVTIFGESAGAASVGFHLTAYKGRDDGLYRAAILQSGNPIFYLPVGGPNKTQAAFNTVASQVGCGSSPDRVQCLREVSFETLNATMNGTISTNEIFNPVIDGDFVQDYGSLQLQRGEFVKVPIVVGANSDEGASFSQTGINTTEQFKDALAKYPAAHQNAILETYPDDLSVNVIANLQNQRPAAQFGQQFRRVASYVGDELFIAPRRQTAITWASHNLTAYAFRFNAKSAGWAPELGVSHFKEIGFVFRNIEGVGWRPDIKPFEGQGQNYIDLAYLMSSMWASFVHELDPNAWQCGSANITKWPKYRVDAPEDFVFDANVTSYAEPDTWRKEGIDLINENAFGIYGR
ncbi:alpha/beta-hydrolase [Massarina eburnea CBS 473.64]|uniref:Carboxylic ester hydrolase n=1 Tax=Massarina eburnea CBS 473.64 TaxID=1395130 RepID=A0A6A6RY45_9PLEO|nr:alpha/beta-hydrolase [Massarina eburnea CBS 473.64]